MQRMKQGDRFALADSAEYWADPMRPSFDPNRDYVDKPIKLTYQLPCREKG